MQSSLERTKDAGIQRLLRRTVTAAAPVPTPYPTEQRLTNIRALPLLIPVATVALAGCLGVDVHGGHTCLRLVPRLYPPSPATVQLCRYRRHSRRYERVEE